MHSKIHHSHLPSLLPSYLLQFHSPRAQVLYTAALSALGARWLLALSLLREAVEGRAAPDTPAATAAVVACGEAEENGWEAGKHWGIGYR